VIFGYSIPPPALIVPSTAVTWLYGYSPTHFEKYRVASLIYSIDLAHSLASLLVNNAQDVIFLLFKSTSPFNT